MSKFIFPPMALAICLCLFSCSNERNVSDNGIALNNVYTSDNLLLGNVDDVKTLKIIFLDAEQSFNNIKYEDTNEVVFVKLDGNGKILKEEYYNEDGIFKTVNYQWEGDRKCILSHSEKWNNTPTTETRFFNEAGKIIEYRIESEDTYKECKYEYNDKGDIVSECAVRSTKNYGADTSVTSYSYEYDNMGRIASVTKTYTNESLAKYYTYGADGSVTVKWNSPGNEIFVGGERVEMYDKNKLPLCYENKNSDGSSSKESYEYSADSKLRRVIYARNGEVQKALVCEILE